jgi:hypothetical protein
MGVPKALHVSAPYFMKKVEQRAEFSLDSDTRQFLELLAAQTNRGESELMDVIVRDYRDRWKGAPVAAVFRQRVATIR